MVIRLAMVRNNMKGILRRGMATAPLFAKRPKTERSLKQQMLPKGKSTGAYVPVYVALGMISLQAALGFHIIKQHLAHDPEVHLKKSRRGTLPEVVDPDSVVKDSSDLISNSFFRKVARIQEFETPLGAPVRGNPLDRY